MNYLTEIWLLLILVVVYAAGVQEEDLPCCPPGQLVLKRKTQCWDPTINVTMPTVLTCNSTEILYPNDRTNLSVNYAGQLVISMQNYEFEYEPKTFCMTNATTTKSFRELRKIQRVALVCLTAKVKVIDENVVGYCTIVSSVFLLITAIIYAALPELRDIQGKSIVNLCVSMCIGFGILAAIKLVPYSDMNLCAVRGFLVYFCLIASFFWMNAISIQILLSIRRPSVINYGWKEFGWYAIYAWGCPALLTIAMAIVNFIPGDHLKPGIGLNHCWFFNNKQQWRYMYSVMSILIIVNICIFIYVSIQLWRQRFSSSHGKALRFKFVMTVRLLIVMGISWVFEMIGSSAGSHIIWEIFDIINSLQGVLIFLVVVIFRRRTIKAMHQNGWLDCMSGPVERFLAVGDDEEDVVPHTIGVTMDDVNK